MKISSSKILNSKFKKDDLIQLITNDGTSYIGTLISIESDEKGLSIVIKGVTDEKFLETLNFPQKYDMLLISLEDIKVIVKLIKPTENSGK